MTLRVEIWPLTADSTGIWLIAGEDGPWQSEPVTVDSTPHKEVEALLAQHQVLEDVRLLHGTSTRSEGTSDIRTYVAVVECPDLAVGRWPQSIPITPELPATIGKPFAAHPAKAPVPRYADVLLHAVRHLHFLLYADSIARPVLDGIWAKHLAAFRPALSGMYEHGDQPLELPSATMLKQILEQA